MGEFIARNMLSWV